MFVAVLILCVLGVGEQAAIYCWKNWTSQVSECFMGTLFQISPAACGHGFTLLSSKTKDGMKVWGMELNRESQLGFHRSQEEKSEALPLAFSAVIG